jgi:hypothetical protein
VINDAVLHQAYTRTLDITQTVTNSHVNNVQITVNCPDKTGFEITKIEVSKDNISWTDITASALDNGQAGKYVYKLTRANTFTPLGYAGNQLQAGAKVYIRETVKLHKCGGGNLTYNIAYGDGNTFCNPISTAPVDINALNPAYSVDYMGSGYLHTIDYGQAGFWNTQILNNSAGSDAIMLKTFASMYDTRYTDSPVHIFDSVFLMDSVGTAVVAKIPLQNTISMSSTSQSSGVVFNLPSHAYIHKVDFENLPKATTPQMINAYTDAGLTDTDGDSIYSDILLKQKVNLRFYYHLEVKDSAVTCPANRLLETHIRSDVFWQNRCEQTYSFSRADHYNPPTTNFNAVRGGMNGPALSLDNNLLAAGDPAILTVMMNNANASSGQGGFPYQKISSTRIHKVEITLPAGLDYDGTDIQIRNGSEPTSIPATEVTWNQITRQLVFRNTKSLVQPIYYEIPVEANSTPDNTKSFHIEHTFALQGMQAPAQHWSCWDATVPYTQKSTCTRLEMANFTAERTSFGWIDTSNLHVRDTAQGRADRNTPGIDLHAVGPYDNITFVTDIAVNGSISLDPGEKLMAELNYVTPYSTALFNMPTSDHKIALHYKKSGQSSYTHVADFSPTVNPTLLTLTNTNININPNHSIGVNIASFIGTVTIPALGTGDTLRLEYFLQTTANIQKTAPQIIQVSAEVYTQQNIDPKKTCFPLILPVKTFNYNLAAPSSPSADYPNINVIDNNASFLRWQMGGSSGGVEEVFPNEYRPNVFYRNMTLTVDALVRINSLYWSGRSNAVAYKMYDMIRDTDYTVDYSNGNTIITILRHPLMMEGYVDYFCGLWIYGSYDIICVDPTKTSITSHSEFERLDYPTSATTADYRQESGNSCTHQCNTLYPQYRYQTSVTTPAALVSPVTPEVSWDFSINNASLWAATDPILPNSWIAFECDAGIIPVELREGNTVIASGASLVPYGGANKWWVKLDSLSVPVSRNYTIRCTYTACSGQPEMKITHGFSRIAYPDNPAYGYRTDYNSPYVCNTQSVTVKMNPPAINFGGVLTHRPSPGQLTKNNFCDTIGFSAEFHNGLSTAVSNLRMEINLPAGFTYESSSAKAKFGTGGWDLATASISNNILTITLNPADTLKAYKDTNAVAYIDFRLRVSCGADNNQSIYARFIGTSGCGMETVKTYNSQNILIAGLEAPPTYRTEMLYLLNSSYLLVSPSQNDIIRLIGEYRLYSSPEDSVYAIIDLPANVDLIGTNGGLAFQQNGSRLMAQLPNYGNVGTLYRFDLMLQAVNPAQWNMDSMTIFIRTGKINALTCDNLNCSMFEYGAYVDSVKFAMQKLEVNFDSTVTAKSRFNSPTSERVEISGSLVNNCAYPSGKLNIDLYYNNGTTYVPVSSIVSGSTVSYVAANGGVTSFTLVADIASNQDICDMRLVLRKNNTADNSLNPYLADSVWAVVPNPVYEIQTQPAEICQTASISIGENSISNYSYSWMPSSYLSASNVTPVTFHYTGSPLYRDTVMRYLVEITRPKGCRSTDTVFVPMKMLPFVDAVSNMKVCHEGTLNVSFTDAHNTGSTYNWTAPSNSAGIPVSGSGPINKTLSNVGSSSETVTVTVTPEKNSCNGTSKQFTVTVHPLPDFVSVADTTVCTAITLSDLISNLPVNSIVRFYRDAAGSSLLPSPRVGILSDTLYYVRSMDTVTGCESVMHTINIHPGSYPPYTLTTGNNVVCLGDTVTLNNSQGGGIWTISDPTTGKLVSPASGSVKVRGLKPGTVYISYTVGTGTCETKITFALKVIPSAPPTVIMGVER